MPTIARLYGVYIYMYKRSSFGKGNRDEHTNNPHIHLEYQGNKIKVYINNLQYKVETGKLLPVMKSVAIAFIEKNKQNLLKMWESGNIHSLD